MEIPIYLYIYIDGKFSFKVFILKRIEFFNSNEKFFKIDLFLVLLNYPLTII